MIYLGSFIAVLPIIASLFIATSVHYKNERKKQKISLLSELMANRHGLTNSTTDNGAKNRFIYELNKTFAVFYDSKKVMTALMNFHIDQVNTATNVTNLLLAICNDLKIDISKIPPGFFEKPFTGRNT